MSCNNSGICVKINIEDSMPFRHREVRTMLLYGFARQLCDMSGCMGVQLQ